MMTSVAPAERKHRPGCLDPRNAWLWSGVLLSTFILWGPSANTSTLNNAQPGFTQQAYAQPAAILKRTYQNQLVKLDNPAPLLADYPEFVQPVIEDVRYEAPILVDDADADLSIRAWRFSYNARGIIEVPNRIRASETAIIMVHPWGN